MAIVSRRASTVLLRLFALFLVGTVIVLMLVRSHFRVDRSAYVLETELGTWDEIRASKRPAVLDHEHVMASSPPDLLPPEKVPRIIHQTWKTDMLPAKWASVREECAKMMPDYEYMLWTDQSSREFIEREYSWFLPTFDSYPYNIQRADAIRYFVLHKFGGVYMDLDIGCRRRLDPLLRFDVIVPKTIPVGVSNDLMFAVPGHPYLDLLIHSLSTFNHYFFTHYATVMFSTGPMFVSAMYRVFVQRNGIVQPSSPSALDRGFEGVRVLPKSLYGKNLSPSDAPDSFFIHMYGSSWHANDAGPLIFLRKYGYLLLFIGMLIVVIGMRRVCLVALAHVLKLVTSFVSSLGSHAGFRADSNRGSSYISLSTTASSSTPMGSKRRELPPSSHFAPIPSTDWFVSSRPSDVEAKIAPSPVHGTTPPVPTFSMNDSPSVYEPSGMLHLPSEPVIKSASQISRSSSPLPQPPLATSANVNARENVDALGHASTHMNASDATVEPSFQRRNSDTNAPLPTYYVGNSVPSSNRFSLSDGGARSPSMPSTGRSNPLKRLSSSTMQTLSTLLPPPMRRSARSSHSDPDEASESLLSLGVDSADGLTRTISRQSEDYRSEWDNLMQDMSESTLRSPTLGPAVSPTPQLIEMPDAASSNSKTNVSGLLRRPHPADPFRTATPGVSAGPTDADLNPSRYPYSSHPSYLHN